MMQQNHTNGRLTDRERTPARLIVLRVLFTLFAAGTVVFIFSNSMQSGTASGLRSAAVTEWLNGGLARVGVGWRFSERLVRKLGHFSEYALLGFWLMLSLRVYTRRILSHISWPLFFGLLAGVLDEGIQIFADGRGSDVRDVVIDFSRRRVWAAGSPVPAAARAHVPCSEGKQNAALGVLTQENRCFLCQRARDAAFFICKRKNGERGGRGREGGAVCTQCRNTFIRRWRPGACWRVWRPQAPAGICAEVREGTVNEPERDVLAAFWTGSRMRCCFRAICGTSGNAASCRRCKGCAAGAHM